MKKRSFTFLVVFMCAVFTGCAAQMPQTVFKPVDLNPKLQSGQLAQKVDTFLILDDVSLSMSEIYSGATKLVQANETIKRMNQTIPDLKLEAGMRSFGYVEGMSLENSKLVWGLTPYTKSGLEASLGNLGRDGGQTPLAMAIDGATGDLKTAKGQMAVIIVSDGQDQDDAPVQAAERMKGQFGSRVCIYTIQMGDHPSGKKILQRIAEASRCGFYTSGDDIAASAAMGDYVERVFLGRAAAKPETKAKQEAPPPVVEERKQAAAAPAETEVKPAPTIRLEVEFDTGKSNVKAKYHNEIKKVADYMNQYPETTAVIEGHTDNVGMRAKNMRLSQDRANSIKNYLVTKFKINSARLKAVGFGPDKPIAGNDTAEGRQKNRRVQAVFDSSGKDNAGAMEAKAEKKAVKKAVKKKVKKAKKVQKVQ